MIENAQKASKHLLSIINNILDISKIEAGEIEVKHLNFNLFNVLDDIQSIFENECLKKNIKFEVNTDNRLNSIFKGDEIRIRQVLLNIIGNSLKFTQKGGIKVISSLIDDDKIIQFQIIDTGIGIRKVDQVKLFKMFGKLNST